jgi:hypothetical protein
MKSIQLDGSALEMGLRWTARVLSALLLSLVLVIVVGEGGFNPLALTPVEATQMVLFWACCTGMLVAWRWQLIGGAISLAAMLVFFAVQFMSAGPPRGPVIYLMLLPGTLFVLGSLIQRPGPAS